MTASIKLMRKKEPRKIIVTQKRKEIRGNGCARIRLNMITDQLSRVIIWNTAIRD